MDLLLQLPLRSLLIAAPIAFHGGQLALQGTQILLKGSLDVSQLVHISGSDNLQLLLCLLHVVPQLFVGLKPLGKALVT